MKRLLRGILRKAGWEVHSMDGIARSTMASGLRWLSKHEIPIETVLDVGASNGSWSRTCMSAYPQATYVLYEPQSVHGPALEAFRRSCGRPVIIVRKAVGHEPGEALFNAFDHNFGAITRRELGVDTIEVEQTSLDASAAELHLRGPYLIKMDTHGFETNILRGAEGVLTQANALIIEAYNYRITGEAVLFWELCADVAERGFRPVDLVDVRHRPLDGSLFQMDLFFIRSSWAGFGNSSYR